MKTRRIEYWVVTAATLVILYVFVQQGLNMLHEAALPGSLIAQRTELFREKDLSYQYLPNDLFPRILYLVTIYFVFLYGNNYLIARYFPARNYGRIALGAAISFVVAALLFAVADYYQTRDVVPGFFSAFIDMLPWTLLVFGVLFVYLEIKWAVFNLFVRSRERSPLSRKILRELLVVTGVWLAAALLIAGFVHSRGLMSFWLSVAPYGYFLFAVNIYWLLPDFERSGRRGARLLLRELLVALGLFVPFFLLASALAGHADDPGAWVLLFLLCTLIAIGVAWLVYRRNREEIMQLVHFKQELGKATSHLHLLRSQINPHFLFNALNTLYGTALQEHAERTGEGIQKLGDMMRFMLHENLEDSISLARELEYIRDYIALQRLRIGTTPDIAVEAEIIDPLDQRRIAPMLLIPFVENAFKHGISLREKSWIRIALRCDAEALYFDVYNSIHRKGPMDPESAPSGLGLENVRQRLEMLYPGRYELVIRETAREYFVHLTLRCAREEAKTAYL